MVVSRLVGAIVTNKSPVTLAQVTPIARLTGEYEVVVVPASSKIKTMKELVDQLKANPGRGWIVVRAKRATRPDLFEAMSKGDFYSSSGVVIKELKNSKDEIVIEMDPYVSERFTTVFYGANGTKLAEEHGASVRLKPPRNQLYVRATIHSSRESFKAWTQPVFPAGR